jgi:hypothetical protein
VTQKWRGRLGEAASEKQGARCEKLDGDSSPSRRVLSSIPIVLKVSEEAGATGRSIVLT